MRKSISLKEFADYCNKNDIGTSGKISIGEMTKTLKDLELPNDIGLFMITYKKAQRQKLVA